MKAKQEVVSSFSVRAVPPLVSLAAGSIVMALCLKGVPQSMMQTALPIYGQAIEGIKNDMLSAWNQMAGQYNPELLQAQTYILPSDSRQINEADLQGFDATRLDLAINEIYARHGLVFTVEPSASYFASQPWYVPNPSLTPEQIVFSETEQKNIDYLVMWAQSNGWR